MNEHQLTVDEIIKIDEQINEDDNNNISEIDDTENLTQHTMITSPWSRLGIIGIPLGAGFLGFYFMFNNIINGNKVSVSPQEQTQSTQSTTEPNNSDENGDVYAKLALSKQEEQLDKIYQQKQKTAAKIEQKQTKEPAKTLKEVTVQKQPVTVASAPPPPPRSVSRSYSSQPRTITTAPERSYSSINPQSLPTTALQTADLTDPIEELNRLRSLGSFGEIVYSSATLNEPVTEDFVGEDTNSVSSTQERQESQPQPQDNFSTPIEFRPESENQNDTNNSIEKIRPRWVSEKSDKSILVANNYLPQEAQILTEQQTRYLMVGEFANGIMVTPAMKQETRGSNPQQSSDNKRFVAKLTEDLHDNYGQVAIPSGTMLAVELVSVDAGSYATVEVTSIIKDNTEYPISRGAISVLADGAKPLIAKKFQDKGGEIAQYDITLGLVSGLGKIGEVLNESDSTTIINSSTNTFNSSSINSSRRNIGGAFLEGAFGTLSNIIGKRTETANTEIAARPNAWYISKGTKVTFMVNRTLELP